jgi:hypothetical protein
LYLRHLAIKKDLSSPLLHNLLKKFKIKRQRHPSLGLAVKIFNLNFFSSSSSFSAPFFSVKNPKKGCKTNSRLLHFIKRLQKVTGAPI